MFALLKVIALYVKSTYFLTIGNVDSYWQVNHVITSTIEHWEAYSRRTTRIMTIAILAIVLLSLSACGGGGGVVSNGVMLDSCPVGYYENPITAVCENMTTSPVNNPNNGVSSLFWTLFGGH